jgi:hypothetical protein
MRKLGLCIGVALMALAVSAPAALAGDTTCVGALPPGVYDNIVVPSGATCNLAGAQVKGNVLAKPESGLFIDPGTNIRGSVEAKQGAQTGSFQATIGGSYKCDHCFFQDVEETHVGGNVDITGADEGDFITGSQIGGNLQIQESSAAGISEFRVNGTTIGGDLKFEKNSGPTDISNNRIDGDLQVFENALFEDGLFNDNQAGGNLQVFKNSGPGLKSVSGNTVREDVQCKENHPPFVGGPNAARKSEEQCRGGQPGG